MESFVPTTNNKVTFPYRDETHHIDIRCYFIRSHIRDNKYFQSHLCAYQELNIADISHPHLQRLAANAIICILLAHETDQ
jgi:hypothetical protein